METLYWTVAVVVVVGFVLYYFLQRRKKPSQPAPSAPREEAQE